MDVIALLVAATAVSACPPAAGLALERAAPSRPHLRWSASDGQAGYVLTWREAVPNGRRLQNVQRVVQDASAPVTVSADIALTKFNVEVAVRCGELQQSAPVRMQFVNDRRVACAAPTDASVTRQGGQARLFWVSSSSAVTHHVTALGLADMQTRWSNDRARPGLSLPPDLGPVVLQVRALCGALPSAPVQVLYTPQD